MAKKYLSLEGLAEYDALIKAMIGAKIDRSEIATDEDAMDVLAELGAIEPITISDGSILTSSTGEVYTL